MLGLQIRWIAPVVTFHPCELSDAYLAKRMIAFLQFDSQEAFVRSIVLHAALLASLAGCCLGSHALAQGTPPAATTRPAASHPAAAASPDGLYNPVADPKAVVTAGHARFTVLTPELIRMEWAADGKFEDHASFVFLNRRLPVPKFTAQTAAPGGMLKIETGKLTLEYRPDNAAFNKENLSIALTVDGKQVVWHPGDIDTANLLGTTRTLDGAKGDKTREPIEPGLISRAGWALVDDSTRPLFDSADFRFTAGAQSPWPWAQLRPAGQRQDLYFFGYGHNYRKALGDYVQVAGRIPLPPRFAFGSWWSRYWDYSDQELDELVKEFHNNNVPLDVLVIDMGWHISKEQLEAMHETDQSNHGLGWSGYTWNPTLFPNPDAFLKRIHAEGLKATLNLHPASGVEPWEKAYPEMARAMGIDPATHKYVPFDITDKKYATNYMNLLHHPLEHQGIDFWWLDWQQEQTTKMEGVMPTWWLNYVHFTDQQREGKRPLLFHRWGGLGNHRYQIGFSGDTFTSWESLAFQPWFTATAANVGYAYWSHDIGGHIPGVVDPELYTRWIQFGAFSPILRTHTTHNVDAERRIWAYPEPYSAIMREAIQLREALEPYTYTEARRTYETGLAFLRPLYYDWPSEDAAYTAKNEYTFGESMIVAPVASAADPSTGLATEPVWIPAGEWIEWPTGARITGPKQLERRFTVAQMPVYVKAGAIVPMQPAMSYTGEKPVDPLIVNVWPQAAGASSSYSLYEDSGVAVEYQKGVFARTPILATQTAETLRVEIGPAVGNYPGMLKQRGYELRLPADWPPVQVTVNGVALRKADALGKNGWRYDGNTLTTIVPVASVSTAAKVTIEVRRAAGSTARRVELDGFAGTMARLRSAYDALWSLHPLSAPPEVLVRTMQTGDRLSYAPETAEAELAGLPAAVAQTIAAMHEAQSKFAGRNGEETKRLPAGDPKLSEAKRRMENRSTAMQRALSLLDSIAH